VPAKRDVLAVAYTTACRFLAAPQVAGADGSMANTVVGTPQYLPPGRLWQPATYIATFVDLLACTADVCYVCAFVSYKRWRAYMCVLQPAALAGHSQLVLFLDVCASSKQHLHDTASAVHVHCTVFAHFPVRVPPQHVFATPPCFDLLQK
jgi:hypothetical protein